ncbi:FkbM family methyltransferase [Phenylobacterium sp. J426]|uniref:FkbM family methyltransferase n=1 Tax=Phenylobacterium sp. J426 TaxID=2898439 RepID=UPI00215117C7|nr:FkbM family methyltransferase [Phenylobacterium sp. J426]MCR5873398.1 FkbM family methyltransferase [Phenylobacterium sp. J426]
MLNSTRASGLTFLFPEGDTVVGPTLQAYGEFAQPEVDFLVEAAAAPEGRYLDVGANIGAIALPFARRRPAWKVTAIEAHRGLAAILAANTHGNHLANVDVINAAAGPTRAIAEFPLLSLDQKVNFGDSGFHRAAAKTPVLQLPLDEIASDADVIKVDVQGFEAEVLRGSTAIRAAGKAIWFLETPADAKARAEVFDLLRAARCELFWFFSPFGTRRSPRNPVEGKGVGGDANWVAVPPGRGAAWPLTPVRDAQEPRPGHADAYPYLERYGFSG